MAAADRESTPGAVPRGGLKVFLGAAPGVGKTVAMLEEARSLRDEGTDVVVAFVEDHGRTKTRAGIGDLEVLPRAVIEHRGAAFEELDLQVVLDRRPQLAIVDELAHTIAGPGRPGAGANHTKRWQDVETLLEAGIDVLSTVNVQHLESLNDVVQAITQTRQRETIPDRVLRAADAVELVDLSPDQLRIRLSRGEVYAAEKVDAALSNYFRVGNLTALRELALLWLADQVEEGLAKYRAEQRIDRTWPARDRIVVAVTGGPESETLIRRAARIVGRTAGRELLAVHVVQDDGLSATDPGAIDRQRAFVESLGGSWHTVVGDDVAEALLGFARGVNATQLVLGVSRHSPWSRLLGPGVSSRVIDGSGDIDVHMVTHQASGSAKRSTPSRGRASALSARRRLLGFLAALLAPPLATASFVWLGAGEDAFGIELLVHTTLVVFVALLGGLWPAIVAAVFGSLLVNWFFTSPTGTLSIAQPATLAALGLFLLIAVAVAWIVDVAARRTRDAMLARSRATLLSELAGGVLRGDGTVAALLGQLAETFAQDAVALGRKGVDGWEQLVGVGGACEPDRATTTLPVGDDLVLALRGRTLSADDRGIVEAYAGRIGAMVQQEQLDEARRTGAELAAGNEMRTALLAAVSHDLRTPLAAIKAGISSLRMGDVTLTDADRAELEQAIEDSADRLDALVANLLDMSRVSSGRLAVGEVAIEPADAVAAALDAVGPAADGVTVAVADDTPAALADFGLVERILANLVENALRYAPDGALTLSVSSVADRVEFRMIDHGPGVPDADKAAMFRPFQRLGDAGIRTGVGLGLAVAEGFARAMGGALTAEDTPGGGLTMVLALPALPARAAADSLAAELGESADG